jgi:hypothetical protein
VADAASLAAVAVAAVVLTTADADLADHVDLADLADHAHHAAFLADAAHVELLAAFHAAHADLAVLAATKLSPQSNLRMYQLGSVPCEQGNTGSVACGRACSFWGSRLLEGERAISGCGGHLDRFVPHSGALALSSSRPSRSASPRCRASSLSFQQATPSASSTRLGGQFGLRRSSRPFRSSLRGFGPELVALQSTRLASLPS